jgi:hypothetical protein
LTALVSQSSRPISVDLPSSTEPQVMKRKGRAWRAMVSGSLSKPESLLWAIGEND